MGDQYAAEIESLHAFFVEWYTGVIEESAFKRLERTLAPEFEMVTPEGKRRDREAVLEGVADAYNRDAEDEFDIEIRNVESIERWDGYATVRYEEWQETDTETTARISTVLFREESDAPGGLVWLDLHETWLEGEQP